MTTYLAPVGSDEKNVKCVTSKVLGTLGKEIIIYIFLKKTTKTGFSQVAINTWCRAILVNSSLVPDLTKTGTDGLTTKNVSFQ